MLSPFFFLAFPQASATADGRKIDGEYTYVDDPDGISDPSVQLSWPVLRESYEFHIMIRYEKESLD